MRDAARTYTELVQARLRVQGYGFEIQAAECSVFEGCRGFSFGVWGVGFGV